MVLLVEVCAGLLATVALLTLLAKRLSVPSPLLLVPAGILLGFIPGLPHIELDPELVLTVFLPPLVYVAGAEISWPDFRRDKRAILLLAVGCVLFSTVLVGAAAHWLMPWLPWAACFVLGAMVSPPDEVAATAMAGRLGLPRRLVQILKGEGGVNDATALTAYNFALAAVVTGTFSLPRASLAFAADVVGEVAYGLAIGWAFSKLAPRISDTSIEIALSLLLPFIAYLPPEQLGGSGVLAAVTAGLYVGEEGIAAISSVSRLRGAGVWETVRFSLENTLFLLTGVELRAILGSITHASPLHLVGLGAALSAAVIVARFLWVFPATYLPRWMFRRIQERDPAPTWEYPFLLSLAGMRGGISLAAALAIPKMAGDKPFPGRPMVIFLTFAVILVTLVVQGPALLVLVRWLGIHKHGQEEAKEAEESTIRAWVDATETALKKLEHPDGDPPDKVLHHVRRIYEQRLKHLKALHHEPNRDLHEQELSLRRQVLQAERDRLIELRDCGEINEEVRLRVQRDFDLEEARLLTHHQHPEE